MVEDDQDELTRDFRGSNHQYSNNLSISAHEGAMTSRNARKNNRMTTDLGEIGGQDRTMFNPNQPRFFDNGAVS